MFGRCGTAAQAVKAVALSPFSIDGEAREENEDLKKKAENDTLSSG